MQGGLKISHYQIIVLIKSDSLLTSLDFSSKQSVKQTLLFVNHEAAIAYLSAKCSLNVELSIPPTGVFTL